MTNFNPPTEDAHAPLEQAPDEPAMGYMDLFAAVRGLLPDQTFFIGVSTQHQVYREPEIAHVPPVDITRWTVSFRFDTAHAGCQAVEGGSADEVFGKLRAALVPVDPIAAVGDISW